MRTVKARNGQPQFRQELLNRFRKQCAFTGACHTAALDAAHLYSYAREGEHRVDEGLLLRKDLHKLLIVSWWVLSSSPDSSSTPRFGKYAVSVVGGCR